MMTWLFWEQIISKWPFISFFLIISEILHDMWSINFWFLLLHIAITYHRGIFVLLYPHKINPLIIINMAINKKIFVGAFHVRVSSISSFNLTNKLSYVSQWPD